MPDNTDLFASEPGITDPAQRKILADVQQQFNISKQIADRQKDRYSPMDLGGTMDNYAIERARQLTDLLNRSMMNKQALDAAAKAAADRNAAIAASGGGGRSSGGGGGSGLTQEQLNALANRIQQQQPGLSKTAAVSKALQYLGLIPQLFGRGVGNDITNNGLIGAGYNAIKNLFGTNTPTPISPELYQNLKQGGWSDQQITDLAKSMVPSTDLTGDLASGMNDINSGVNFGGNPDQSNYNQPLSPEDYFRYQDQGFTDDQINSMGMMTGANDNNNIFIPPPPPPFDPNYGVGPGE